MGWVVLVLTDSPCKIKLNLSEPLLLTSCHLQVGFIANLRHEKMHKILSQVCNTSTCAIASSGYFIQYTKEKFGGH